MPDRQPGKCVSLYDCPKIASRVSGGVSNEMAEYLRSLSCEDGIGQYPYVCCEIVSNVPQETTVPTVTERPTRPTRPTQTESGSGANLLPPSGKCGIQSLGDRIYDGNATKLDEFPWMALLEYKAGKFFLMYYLFRDCLKTDKFLVHIISELA